MSMAVGGAKGVKSDINMTPMIDVLLVLIIIFMVITPLTPKGLEALVPQPPPPNQKANQSDQRTVVITIDAAHNLAINSEATDDAHLGSRLLQTKRRTSRTSVPWSSRLMPRTTWPSTARLPMTPIWAAASSKPKGEPVGPAYRGHHD